MRSSFSVIIYVNKNRGEAVAEQDSSATPGRYTDIGERSISVVTEQMVRFHPASPGGPTDLMPRTGNRRNETAFVPGVGGSARS